MTVNDIYEFLAQKYPLETACSFDNPGFLVGDRNAVVTKALICLDCSINAVSEAVKQGCQLIITHHPVIFSGLKSITDGSIVFEILKNGISVISMHTNLDIAVGGVNDCLCDALQLDNVVTITAHDGYSLRKGSISPIHSDELAKRIKEKLGGYVKYVGCREKIKNILVCSGSGGEFFVDVKNNDCQALITADVKHNVFIDAGILNIAVFDAGHFNTEDVVIEPLALLLKQKFSSIDFITSHSSEIKYL